MRRARKDEIDAAAVHERNGDGELVATEWLRLIVPAGMIRFVADAQGREYAELNVMAAIALIADRPTADRIREAIYLCRCPEPAGPWEDLK